MEIIEKGCWYKWANKIFVRCPNCCNNLALNHEISTDGIVTPSIVCPVNGCDFHDTIKLEGF